jgi:RHS repeat-associated protein
MSLPNRKFNSGNYRYGFNGKENDKETSSTTTYDYGFRIYNPGLGRFLSTDPLTKSFPWNSTYAFAENDVIRSIDLDGLEKLIIHEIYDKYGRIAETNLSGIRDKELKTAINTNMISASGIKLTEDDVYIIRHRNNSSNSIFFEGGAGKLSDYQNRQISTAPVVQGEADNSLPDNTMRASESTSRGNFYKGELKNMEGTEFFEKQFNYGNSQPVNSGTRTSVSNVDIVGGTFDSKTLQTTSTGRYGTAGFKMVTEGIINQGKAFLAENGLNIAIVESITITIPNNKTDGLKELTKSLSSQFNISQNKITIRLDPNITAKDAGAPIGTIKSTDGAIHVDATYSGVRDGNRNRAEKGAIMR